MLVGGGELRPGGSRRRREGLLLQREVRSGLPHGLLPDTGPETGPDSRPDQTFRRTLAHLVPGHRFGHTDRPGDDFRPAARDFLAQRLDRHATLPACVENQV